uniref:Uncharacterized protein n=1 Tax=Eucampia antarctica TaxID=49252 RepID=A0A7S2WL92_9STRA
MGKETRKKPTFALRVLVQERLADIIAVDVAGYQSHVEINGSTLSVTIDKLSDTANKWMIPRIGRKAFRAVAFEILYFVGERSLVTRGSDALFDLTPLEFHKLFVPLIASMGDFDAMSNWLEKTEVLAEADLKRDASKYSFLEHSSSWDNGDSDSNSSPNSLRKNKSEEDHFDSRTIT